MFDNLALHPGTRLQLENFTAAPSHAVLLAGPSGIGKLALAQALGAGVLDLRELANYPYSLAIGPQDGTISVEQIRTLRQFVRLKTIGERTIRRLAIIEQADAMTFEAQNALLKLLEEPPADTLFVLTASRPSALLPTVLSRVQQIVLHAPIEDDLKKLHTAVGDDDWRQAYLLGGGLPGLVHALLSKDEPHPLTGQINLAKNMLAKGPFDRLIAVDGLSKQKDAVQNLLTALARIAEAGLDAAAVQGSTTKIKRWHQLRKEVIAAQDALKKNANAKLVLSNLLLHL
jgi:hypothetical protein